MFEKCMCMCVRGLYSVVKYVGRDCMITKQFFFVFFLQNTIHGVVYEYHYNINFYFSHSSFHEHKYKIIMVWIACWVWQSIEWKLSNFQKYLFEYFYIIFLFYASVVSQKIITHFWKRRWWFSVMCICLYVSSCVSMHTFRFLLLLLLCFFIYVVSKRSLTLNDRLRRIFRISTHAHIHIVCVVYECALNATKSKLGK